MIITLVVGGVVLVMLLGVSAYYMLVVMEQQKPVEPETKTGKPVYELKLKDETFKLEIAADEETRRIGLGGVTEMAADEGMIFIFPDAQRRSFWMKDCKIALDIIFVTPDGVIDSIHTLNPPAPGATDDELETAQSFAASRVVIELNAGRAKEIGLQDGDRIVIDYFAIQDILAR